MCYKFLVLVSRGVILLYRHNIALSMGPIVMSTEQKYVDLQISTAGKIIRMKTNREVNPL